MPNSEENPDQVTPDKCEDEEDGTVKDCLDSCCKFHSQCFSALRHNCTGLEPYKWQWDEKATYTDSPIKITLHTILLILYSKRRLYARTASTSETKTEPARLARRPFSQRFTLLFPTKFFKYFFHDPEHECHCESCQCDKKFAECFVQYPCPKVLCTF